MKMTIRNRIKDHRRVRAGDLVPHGHNWRSHPDFQKDALKALYAEVGFARSLLAYELPDGRLKLIDGHLRRELDPDMLVEVEVLDVDDHEARKLLLSMDSVASLAEADQEVIAELQQITQSDSPVLTDLWRSGPTTNPFSMGFLKTCRSRKSSSCCLPWDFPRRRVG
jgi:hypothetical protein